MRITIIILLLLTAVSVFAGELNMEYAIGIGSPYFPTSRYWDGRVALDALYYRENAVRAGYDLSRQLKLTMAVGQIDERIESQMYIPEIPRGERYHTRKITYFLPSIGLNLDEIRLGLGTIIYKSEGTARSSTYPFDGGHKFKPSFGIELGEKPIYLLLNLYNSIPLYSGGGGWEIGIGRKSVDAYEQKLFVYSGIFESAGIGYRGEFRVYKKTALTLGLLTGSIDSNNSIYSLTAGIKSVIPQR